MKLHQLRDLLAIVEKGSINAASRHLQIAQPSLSRSLRELEKELGAPLFERQATGTVLTPIGALFARRASAAVHELRRARDEVEQMQGGVQGTVVACISSMSHIALLEEALAPFRARYPSVQLKIIEGVYPVVETRLRSGTIDVYVGPAPPRGPAPDLQLEKLCDNTRVVMARRGHPLRNATHMAELIGADWISTSITDHAEAEFKVLFATLNLPTPRIVLEAESALTWITAVTSTDMLVISPVQWLDHPLTRDLLVRIAVQEHLEAAPIVLVRRGAIPPTPAAEFLCDLLRRPASRIQRQLEKQSGA